MKKWINTLKKYFEKANIESYDVFDLFRESNFYHVIAYVKKFSNSIISDFYVPFYSWKEGATSQNKDFLIPRHENVKKPTALFYKIDIQTISKTITILSENCSFSSIHNEVNQEAKISVAE